MDIHAALADLLHAIPRRHSMDNVKEINNLLAQYEDLLISIEAINPFYEKNIATFFDTADDIKIGIKKSNDNKASKKAKDTFFDEASSNFKDAVENLILLFGNGKRLA